MNATTYNDADGEYHICGRCSKDYEDIAVAVACCAKFAETPLPDGCLATRQGVTERTLDYLSKPNAVVLYGEK